MSETTVTTVDGKQVREGDRAFNYYDGWWGTVGRIDEQGWFNLTGEDGRRAALDGERIALVVPATNPYYQAWLAGVIAEAERVQDAIVADVEAEQDLGPQSPQEADDAAAHRARFDCD